MDFLTLIVFELREDQTTLPLPAPPATSPTTLPATSPATSPAPRSKPPTAT